MEQKPKRPKTPGSGRKKGSKNKSTLTRLEEIKKACEMIANANGSKVFEGDAQALLTAIYKCESFPLDVRMKAAEMATLASVLRCRRSTATSKSNDILS
jgi:hypothetical protein